MTMSSREVTFFVEVGDRRPIAGIRVGQEVFEVDRRGGPRKALEDTLGYTGMATVSERYFALMLHLALRSAEAGKDSIEVALEEVLALPGWTDKPLHAKKGILKAFQAGTQNRAVRLEGEMVVWRPQCTVRVEDAVAARSYLDGRGSAAAALEGLHTLWVNLERSGDKVAVRFTDPEASEKDAILGEGEADELHQGAEFDDPTLRKIVRSLASGDYQAMLDNHNQVLVGSWLRDQTMGTLASNIAKALEGRRRVALRFITKDPFLLSLPWHMLTLGSGVFVTDLDWEVAASPCEPKRMLGGSEAIVPLEPTILVVAADQALDENELQEWSASLGRPGADNEKPQATVLRVRTWEQMRDCIKGEVPIHVLYIVGQTSLPGADSCGVWFEGSAGPLLVGAKALSEALEGSHRDALGLVCLATSGACQPATFAHIAEGGKHGTTVLVGRGEKRVQRSLFESLLERVVLWREDPVGALPGVVFSARYGPSVGLGGGAPRWIAPACFAPFGRRWSDAGHHSQAKARDGERRRAIGLVVDTLDHRVILDHKVPRAVVEDELRGMVSYEMGNQRAQTKLAEDKLRGASTSRGPLVFCWYGERFHGVPQFHDSLRYLLEVKLSDLITPVCRTLFWPDDHEALVDSLNQALCQAVGVQKRSEIKGIVTNAPAKSGCVRVLYVDFTTFTTKLPEDGQGRMLDARMNRKLLLQLLSWCCLRADDLAPEVRLVMGLSFEPPGSPRESENERLGDEQRVEDAQVQKRVALAERGIESLGKGLREVKVRHEVPVIRAATMGSMDDSPEQRGADICVLPPLGPLEERDVESFLRMHPHLREGDEDWTRFIPALARIIRNISGGEYQRTVNAIYYVCKDWRGFLGQHRKELAP